MRRNQAPEPTKDQYGSFTEEEFAPSSSMTITFIRPSDRNAATI